MFDEQLVTVWSAPNYCYRCGNLASILTIGENGQRSFTVFGPAEENARDEAMANGRKVMLLPPDFEHDSLMRYFVFHPD